MDKFKNHVISPTGLGIRNDGAGGGYYGALRGNRKHAGIDFICIPGKTIVAPISGKIARVARPYADGGYSGVEIVGELMTVKVFYFNPLEHLVKCFVTQGEIIGKAQDITQRYLNDKAMTPHVHLEIVKCDPAFFMDDKLFE